jgi:hypothetical protein
MRASKLITLVAMSILLVALNATSGEAKTSRWRSIVGIVEAGNLVGSGDLGFLGPFGVDGVLGGAPWSTLGGGAQVDPNKGNVQFQVKGLVLAAGSASAFGLSGLPIGTPDGVTDVIGTLVCDIDGSAGGGTSTVVDTPPVPLSSAGNAQFSGNIGSLPAACTDEPDIAFLIRIFNPAAFRGVWIANGAVLVVDGAGG